MLKQGVLRSIPHKPRGALPLPAFMLMAVVAAWGSRSEWWKRMIALIALLAFLALLRANGILAVPLRGNTWVVGTQEFVNPAFPPRRHSGVLLLVPSRKSKQHQPSWIPFRAGRATRLLRRFLRWRRSHARRNAFLFPSHKPYFAGRRRAWRPHGSNGMSPSSLLRLLRAALVEVCGLSKAQAARFTLHSLRVGGINYMRQCGVEIGFRARIATHKSLVTARRYNRMLPIERLSELSSLIES